MKIAFITGASSGIGAAAARRLAENGFHVLAAVRQAKDLAAWGKVPNVTALRLDVTSGESVRAAVAEAQPLLRKASELCLVNNAGIAVAGPVEAVRIERWQEQFETNVFGLLRVTQALLPQLREKRGRIVNVSSVSGLATNPYLGPYSASKFAVEAISDALRRELRQFGVKVIVLEPGPVATPIWEKNLAKKDALFNDLTAELRPLYEPELLKFQALVEMSAASAVPVDEVTTVLLRALKSKSPRTRYVIGAAAMRVAAKLSRVLPDQAVDWLVARELARERPRRRM